MALEWLIRKTRRKEDAAQRIEWMLTRKTATEAGQPDGTEWRVPSYGDLISLNSSRLILDSVGVSLLSDIAGDLVDLLGTSCAVYEKNGDYALRILSSDWCRFMDQASRRRCDMPDNREAMESGKWHCHESGWNEAALRSIETKEPVDIECRGGIRIFAVPIRAGEETVGSITVGYGDPPRDSAKLKELASDYGVKVKDLLQQAGAYDTRPPFITELARKRVLSSARIIGEIVARKQAEHALRQSEEKFRALFDNAMDAIVLHDLEGHTIELNREAYERLGYTREEILKMTPDEIDARGGTLPELIESLRREGRHLFESVHRRRDGTEIPVEVSVRLFELAGKQLVLSVSRDISERKRAEADLRRSEDKFRSLVETISDWVWEIDQTGVYIYASPRIRDLLGYEPEEVLGKAPFDFMVPGERERVARIFHEAAQQRAPLNGIENMKIHKSGKRVDLETS
ncbi:MAG: PAS domain S-box protein, partial [Deltaproteobacteria bacterium]|nr:PAS domain S-box protein [Deltaproteobacteria bacterium]